MFYVSHLLDQYMELLIICLTKNILSYFFFWVGTVQIIKTAQNMIKNARLCS